MFSTSFSLLFSNTIFAKLHSDSLDVLSYTIRLNLTDIPGQNITGNTELTIVSRINNLNRVSLDLLKLTIDTIKVNNIVISSYTYNDTLLNIPVSPFAMNDTFKVTVLYHGHPVIDPSGWGGFYFTATTAYNLGVGFDDIPHNYGRVWFPCLDDFVDRALYDCYITVNSGNKAVCGGTLMGVTNNGNGTSTYHWALHNDIPTYLASVAAGNYTAVKDTFPGLQGNIPIEIYVNPADTNKAKNSFLHLKQILSAFEDDFGPSRWERVGYVGVPFNGGAMEHATNITYPNACIDGTLNYEYLYAHELSHHWFGDLITCHSEADMWINEGWATFCETIFHEKLYGKTAYKNYVRNKHNEAVRYLHIEDNGYRAVYDLPLSMTYCSTVYEKGADVAHTLRGYLGDTVFFNAVKQMLNDYAFKDISTFEMRDFLSGYTGVNLNDFFDFWVFSPGFTHFSVDSFTVAGNGPYDVTVYVRQKLRGATQFANSNRIEVTLMNNNWEKYSGLLTFSGQTGSAVFTIPFIPTVAMLDMEEKISDATVDNYTTIKTVANYTFDKTYFIALVNIVTDSAFLRVTHNWAAPDPLKTPVPGLTISPNHYWRIDGILPAGFKAKGKFSYNAGVTSQLDNELITNTLDSLRILWRPNTAQDWRPVHFIKQGNAYIGSITVDTLRLGEYTMVLYDWNMNNKINNAAGNSNLKIFPNPSDSEYIFEFKMNMNGVLKIYDSSGRQVFSENITAQQTSLKWRPGKLQKGIYTAELSEGKNRIAREKIIHN
ncbi:MAG: T9SS type A sorting domain-containing protein [Bacteroidia bacterium]|nr:T9SS type A sorting domain-containing protein [Bacteroidia bacterium]